MILGKNGTYFLFGILLALIPWGLPAQGTPDPEQSYREETIERQEINESNWKKATRGLDYSPPETTRRQPRGTMGGNGRRVVIILAIIAGAALLAFLIAYLLGYIQLKPKKEKEQIRVSVEEVEDRLLEADLRSLIQEALARENYNSAIRLYYLLCLKELSLAKLIRWKKQKTNRNYLGELRSGPYYAPFQELTRIFDRVWYGAMPLNRDTYQELVPQFEDFLTRIQARRPSVSLAP